MVYGVQIQPSESPKLLTNGQCPIYFLADAIPGCIYINYYHQANNRSKYADGLYNSIINDKDGHIPSPLIIVTCTALRHALLESPQNKGDHPKASKSQPKANRPDHLNYFNYMKDGCKNASCWAATGRKLLHSPGVAEAYTFLMNTWNTLPESYQQRVYNSTLVTVRCQIQQAENPTPAVVIRMEAAGVDNASLQAYLTSEVALEEPGIGRTDQNIPIENNRIDDELHFGMPGGSGHFEDEGDESDERDFLPTASWRRRPATELTRFDLGTSDVDCHEGEDCYDADADEEKEASHANDGSIQNVEDWGHIRLDLGTSDVDGYECQDEDDADVDEEESALQPDHASTQNVEDWGHSTRECEDWTVYFRPVKYDDGELNATASDVFEPKTVLE